MTHIQGTGAGNPIRPPSPTPLTPAEEAAAPAPLPTTTPVVRAQDALATMGLSLAAQFAEGGAELSGLVDEAALPLEGVLRGGSDPAAVSALQASLNALGQDPALELDGAYGPLTTAAVKAFQERMGLAADGLAGPNTKRALQAVEAMTLAAASKDPEEVAAFKEAAQELISGIQPEAEQATLQAQLDALAVAPLNAADPSGAGVAAEVAEVADALAAELAPELPARAEDLLPHLPAEGGELEGRTGAAEAPSAVEVAIDADARAEVEAVAAAGGADAVGAVMGTEMGAELATGGQVQGSQEVLDQFWVGNGDAQVAGQMAARIVNENPSALDGIWSQLQESAGANNGEAFIEGFLSELDPEVAKQLPVLCPETMASMLGEYSIAERLWGDESQSILAALSANAELDPSALVGEQLVADYAALQAASDAGTLRDLVTPEWVAGASSEALNRAFQLACHDRTSAEDAAIAGQLAAEMMTRDPATAPLIYQQFDAYDTGNHDDFVDAIATHMGAEALGRVATVFPDLVMDMQQVGGLSEGMPERLQEAWKMASPEAQKRAFDRLAAGRTTASEAAQMGRLAAQLAIADPAQLEGLVAQFNAADMGNYGDFIGALLAGGDPILLAEAARLGLS